MNIITVYARMTDGAILQVLPSTGILGKQAEGTLEVARFDASAYPEKYAALANNTKFIHFIDGALVLDTHPEYVRQVLADEAWILARKAEVEAFEAEKIADSDARTHILQQASAALTQIENDRATIAASNIPAPVKTVMDNTLNRQAAIIKALRAMYRSGLTDT